MDEKEVNDAMQPETNIDELLDQWMKEELASAPETPVEEAPVQEETAKPSRRSRKDVNGWQGNVLMYLHDLTYLLAGLILVFLLLFRVVVVSGTSMNSTLMDGDYLLLLSSAFYHDPQPGDIIVASKASFDNGAPIVKRVIATEGQVVDIDFKTGTVYVDGVALDEPYINNLTTNQEGLTFPITVKPGCLFVLGDNRQNSKDSRSPEIGLIDKREVLGKVFFLFVPGTNKGQVKQDFGRIGVIG